MKKGIIAAIVVAICVMLAATYTFANPSKAAKTEPTTTEEKEVTTTATEKTTTEATTESKKAAIKKETSEEVDTDQEKDDSEEIEDQEEEIDSEDEEEIDDEKMDQCDHNWTDGSYAYDTEKGYVYTESCSKCHLVKDTPVSYEEYEEATKDQEPNEEDCIYEDNDNAEVVE